MKFGQWLGFVCLIISLCILWQIRQLLLLVFTAVVLSIALNRIVRYWQKFNLSATLDRIVLRLRVFNLPPVILNRLAYRWQPLELTRNQAITITLLLTLLVTLLFFWLVVPPFIEQFQKLLELLPSVWEQLRSDLTKLREQTLEFDWLPPIPSLSDLLQEFQPLGTLVFTNFFAFFSNSLTAILQLLLVLVLAIMLLFNPQSYRHSFLQLFPSFYRRRADEIITLSEAALGNWLVGIVLDSSIVALLSAIALSILQINLILVHALLAGLLNFIPNIGPTLSVIFPIMIALLDSPEKIILILFFYFCIQNIESYVLAPIIMSQQVSLLPAVTLMAQIFFAQIFGLLGLLLALPLTIVVKVWIEETLFKDILDKWKLEPNYVYETSYLPSETRPSLSEDYAGEEN